MWPPAAGSCRECSRATLLSSNRRGRLTNECADSRQNDSYQRAEYQRLNLENEKFALEFQ